MIRREETRTYRSTALARVEADAEDRSAVAQLVADGDIFALSFREALGADDVVCVFEAAHGGIADIICAKRAAAAALDDGGTIKSLLSAQPRGTLVMVLRADGSAVARRSAVAMLNATGGAA